MSHLYALEQATQFLDLSAAIVGAYIKEYGARLSAQANQLPPTFTDEDLRLLAYVKQRLVNLPSPTPGAILMDIENGAVATFDWTPPAAQREHPSAGHQTSAPAQRDAPFKMISAVKEIRTTIASNITPIAIFAIALLLISLFFIAIWRSKDILSPLEEIAYARGLITFIVAFSTMATALILTLYAILSDGDAVEDRFNRGKEILTIFIGVLGTIVGFYFGSTPATPNLTTGITTRPFAISNARPRNDETMTIMATVVGGTPPYIYTIKFNPPGIMADIKPTLSTDGMIWTSIPISTALIGETEVEFQLDLVDHEQRMATIAGGKIVISPE
jgi:hypothetical protein